MPTLRLVTLLRCFMRTYLTAAAYNTRGLQNIGFVYVMEPGLKELYASKTPLQEARGRYLRHHNCHPFWNPMLAGVFLHTEASIAKGTFSAQAFVSVKDTTTNTLSAVGDSVFGGSLLVTCALTCCNLIIAGQEIAAMAFTLAVFIALQTFKLATFIAGLRYGFATLLRLRRWDLINWGDTLKLCNAALLVLFLFQIAEPAQTPMRWLVALPVTACAAWLIAKVHISRILLAYTGLLVAIGVYLLRNSKLL